MPQTLDEAYEALLHHKDAMIIGGGAFLKLQNRSVETAIDLSALQLDFIEEKTGMVEIGPMVTLHTFETHKALPQALRECVRNIANVAVRNVATIGGTISGRYPFSDIISALLALNAHLEFYHHGHISLESYLLTPFEEKDILTKIVVPQVHESLFKSVTKTYTDFSIVNMAISKNKDLRITIGARPSIATVIINPDLDLAPSEILKDISFGSDFRAGEAYRRTLAETLLEDALKEVKQWK
jgi:CO/xanthine dehydrogenase FAD-binding subunit